MLAGTLFMLAAGATLTTWVDSPIPRWAYELGICLLGAVIFGLSAGSHREEVSSLVPTVALVLIGMWGFGQLLARWTVYRWATLNGALRMVGLTATVLVAGKALRTPQVRSRFLGALAWFGFLLSGIAVLAYFTSVKRVLWIFPAPYPDVWGPFLSRNNFAQFMELTEPVALALAFQPGQETQQTRGFPVMSASMLAAGVSSASRAGALLLVAETCTVLWLAIRKTPGGMNLRPLRMKLLQFVSAGALFGTIGGAGAVWGRLKQPDPFKYRREIYISTLAMIRDHPLVGNGLGTYARVYPAYALFDSGAAVEQAHSDWLEWAAEGGLVFAAVWGVFFLWLVRPAIRSIWGLGVLGVFVHAGVDYPFARFGVAAWALILAGALMGFDRANTEMRKPKRSRTK